MSRPQENTSDGGYEVFAPPAAIKPNIVKDLNTKVESLSKELQEVTKKVTALEEANISEMKQTLQRALKRLIKLEKVSPAQDGHQNRTDTASHAALPSDPEGNKQYLRTLNSHQVRGNCCYLWEWVLIIEIEP